MIAEQARATPSFSEAVVSECCFVILRYLCRLACACELALQF